YFGRKLDGNDPGDVFVVTRALIAAPGSTQSAPGLGTPMQVLLAALLACGAWLARRTGGVRATRR
ncbi:MAG: hypothetical protein JSS59_01210, partial [Proteobacteria bacterium]|nr:hypothetical protein [Pseudomonadota bacterium]